MAVTTKVSPLEKVEQEGAGENAICSFIRRRVWRGEQ